MQHSFKIFIFISWKIVETIASNKYKVILFGLSYV